MFRLYDTSVWIEYKNGIISNRTNQLDHDLIFNQVCICPIIIQEVLQGIRSNQDFAELEIDFRSLKLLNWEGLEAAVSAAKLYRQL